MPEFDIVIVGGGLVGASLACALSSTNMRIAVVEAAAYDAGQQPSYDDRVLAIAQGSARILNTMGVWGGIPATEVTPIRTIHISDRGHFGSVRLRHHKHEVEALGYTVTARALGRALITKLEHEPTIDIFCPARVEELEVESGRVVLRLVEHPEKDRLGCKLVVFADGSGSALRQSLGFETARRSYHLSAVLTTVTPDMRHNNIAYERFTETGPLALLPSVDNRYAVVWSTVEERVNKLLDCSDEDFLGMLQRRFGDRVGRLSALGKRKDYPLNFLHVKRPIRDRIVIVGNAAHTVHPVAGQGFNLGLRDVAALAEVLFEADRAGWDIGGLEVLERYWQWRRRDVVRVGWFTDGLIRVFSNSCRPLAALRDSALLAVDLVPPVQRALVTRTMGLNGKLPRLARGLGLE